jgi:hypothetical protein
METLEGEEVQLLLTHDLGTRWGWVVSVTTRPRFNLGERTPDTHCTGGWVGPRAGLAQRIEEKSFAPAGDRTPITQPVVRHYTAWATWLILGLYRPHKTSRITISAINRSVNGICSLHIGDIFLYVLSTSYWKRAAYSTNLKWEAWQNFKSSVCSTRSCHLPGILWSSRMRKRRKKAWSTCRPAGHVRPLTTWNRPAKLFINLSRVTTGSFTSFQPTDLKKSWFLSCLLLYGQVPHILLTLKPFRQM